METSVAIDRLAMRARPAGSPVMHQNWENLLFLHWPIDPQLLRPIIPAALTIDTFEDKAWIGITPFALTDLRLMSMPPIPGFRAFNELNARTYVVCNGMPGIWFFSLDASKLLPALAARLFFMLPYYKADIDFTRAGEQFAFELNRSVEPAAQFSARWRAGLRMRAPDLESLGFFLVERYCYFANRDGQIFQTRIYHVPWTLEEAIMTSYASNMISALNLPEPVSNPLAHFSRRLSVEFWPPAAV